MPRKRALPPGAVVLDASVLIGIVDRNRDAQAFVGILPRARVTAVNFGETLYRLKTMANADPLRVEQALLATGLVVEPFGRESARHFPELKAVDLACRIAQRSAGVPEESVKSLSLADLSCLAYALEFDLPVLTGDRHWCELRKHGLRLAVFDFRDPATLP